LVETQANVYERFRSGMMGKEKEKKPEEKPEHLDKNDEDSSGELSPKCSTGSVIWSVMSLNQPLDNEYYLCRHPLDLLGSFRE